MDEPSPQRRRQDRRRRAVDFTRLVSAARKDATPVQRAELEAWLAEVKRILATSPAPSELVFTKMDARVRKIMGPDWRPDLFSPEGRGPGRGW